MRGRSVISTPEAAPGFGPAPLFSRVLWALAILFLAGAEPALAERYLTLDEAKKLCFPEADAFEKETHRYQAAEIKEIQKRTGVKTKNPAQRYFVARKEGKTVGVLILDFVLGKHEVIDYVVAFSADGKIRQVEILEFRESHGYEIRGEKWRDQFKGKGPHDRLRLNDDIYNISGATISCRNVSEGTRRLVAFFDLVVRPHVDSGVRDDSEG